MSNHQLQISPAIARTLVAAVMVCLFTFPLIAQTNAPASTPAFLKETIRSMDSLDNRQKLGPGDRITYRVIEDQDDPRTLLITDSGDLEVPYLGLVHAAGKTCLELAREIKAHLEKKLYFTATVMISAEVINKTRVMVKSL